MKINKISRYLVLQLVILSISFLFSACGKTPIHEENLLAELFVGDFESGTLDDHWDQQIGHQGTDFIEIVNNPVKQGEYACKFTVNGDLNENSETQTDRTELNINQYSHGYYKSSCWYSWSFMIDSTYVNSTDWQIIGQWHDIPDYINGETNFKESQPPLMINYSDDKIGITFSNPHNNTDFTVAGTRSINKGIWHTIIVNAYWSDDSKAYAEAWLDGTPLTPFNGTDFKYYHRNVNSKAGNRLFKIGLYRSAKINTKSIIFCDNVRIGNNFSEVQ